MDIIAEEYIVIFNGKEYDRESIKQRVGCMEQIAGIRKLVFTDGKAKGVRGLEVTTGGGLEYTVITDRGLDIAYAKYRGIPFSFLSKTGIVAPEYFVEQGADGFLRSFYAGLLTTCGYTYMGAPGKDGEEQLGLHGRASSIPAKKVNVFEKWIEDKYLLEIEGCVRECVTLKDNILLQRSISTQVGEDVIRIKDIAVNDGFVDSPLMLLYHINFGFPLVSKLSEIFVPTKSTIQYGQENVDDDYTKAESPHPGYQEKVFYHTLLANENGDTVVAIYNPVECGFGIYIKFNINELPCFTQWKQMGAQDYAIGLEPGTYITTGRAAAKEDDMVIYLRPGEQRCVNLEIGVIKDENELNNIKLQFA